MTMALYELAYRSEIQEKLRTEVEKVIIRHHGNISYDAISEMTYLDQVVNGIFIHFHFLSFLTDFQFLYFRNSSLVFTNWTIV